MLKKTAYGVLYIGIAGLVGYAIISPFLSKKNTTNTVVKAPEYAPIIIENIVALPHIEPVGQNGKTVDVVVRIRNTNPNAGIVRYPVTFTLYDSAGTVINAVTQQEYVLPGGIQYIAGLDIPVPPGSTYGRVEVTTPKNPEFITIPDNAPNPQFALFLRERTLQSSGSFPQEHQTGIVTNNSSFDWQKVQVTAVALDNNGQVIGVGKTFVGKLLTGEQREFTLVWPRPNSATNRVIAIATTDMFSDSNVVNVIGDPSKLR